MHYIALLSKVVYNLVFIHAQTLTHQWQEGTIPTIGSSLGFCCAGGAGDQTTDPTEPQK